MISSVVISTVRGRARDVGVHVRVAVDLGVAEAVGPVHVQDGHVGEEGRHRGQASAPVYGILDGLHPAHAHQVRAQHGQGGQEGHAHGRRAEAQAEGEVAPFLEGHLSRFHVVAEDLRHAPGQADGHPRGDHALHAARHHEELALGAHEVAREGEPPAALAEDLAHQGHRACARRGSRPRRRGRRPGRAPPRPRRW